MVSCPGDQALPNRRFAFRRLLAAAALSLAAAALPAATAFAQSASANAKLAPELRSLLAGNGTAGTTWLRSLGGQPYVKVLIVAPGGTAPELAELRREILARGGSVHYNYVSLRALSAMLPLSALPALSARGDVLSITPNRPASKN